MHATIIESYIHQSTDVHVQITVECMYTTRSIFPKNFFNKNVIVCIKHIKFNIGGEIIFLYNTIIIIIKHAAIMVQFV